MALTDACSYRLEKAMASRAYAKEIVTLINGLGAIAAGSYPSASGAAQLGSADTDILTLKGLLQLSSPTGIVAAGTTQGTATALTAAINNVGTVGANEGVKLTANT